MDQPELRVSSGVLSRLVVLPFHASVARRASIYGFDRQLVSIQPVGGRRPLSPHPFLSGARCPTALWRHRSPPGHRARSPLRRPAKARRGTGSRPRRAARVDLNCCSSVSIPVTVKRRFQASQPVGNLLCVHSVHRCPTLSGCRRRPPPMRWRDLPGGARGKPRKRADGSSSGIADSGGVPGGGTGAWAGGEDAARSGGREPCGGGAVGEKAWHPLAQTRNPLRSSRRLARESR